MSSARHLAPEPVARPRSRAALARSRRRARRRRSGVRLVVALGLVGVAPLVSGDLAPAGPAPAAALAGATAAGRGLDRTDGTRALAAVFSDDLEVPEDGLAGVPWDDGIEGADAIEGVDGGWPEEGHALDGDDPAYGGTFDDADRADEVYGDRPDDLGDDLSDGYAYGDGEGPGSLAGPGPTADRTPPAAPAPPTGGPAPSGPPSAPAPTAVPTAPPTTSPPGGAPSAATPAPLPPAPTTSREPDGASPGPDRFEAAARRALAEHPDGAPTVHLVVDGSLWAAAAGAGGGSIGGSIGGSAVPVLLTTARCLPAATAGAIETLGARDVVLLGPRGAVDAGALTAPCR